MILAVLSLGIAACSYAMRREAIQLNRGIIVESLQKQTEAIAQKVFKSFGIPAKLAPDITIINTFPEKQRWISRWFATPIANYHPIRHRIAINRQVFLKGKELDALQEYASHEAYHAVQNLLRAKLPKKDYAKILRDAIIQHIEQGHATKAKGENPLNHMSAPLRQDYLDFLKTRILKDKPLDKQAAAKQLLTLVKRSQNARTNPMDTALPLAEQAAILHNFYRDCLKIQVPQTVRQDIKRLPPLSKHEKRHTLQLAKDHIEARLSHSLSKTGSLRQYYRQQEEIEARLFSYRYMLDYLAQSGPDNIAIKKYYQSKINQDSQRLKRHQSEG